MEKSRQHEKDKEKGLEEREVFNSYKIALGLYRGMVANHSGNTVISPYSIVDAVSLMYNAADGKVKQEMDTVLGLSNKQVSLYRAYDKSEEPGFEVANKAFYDLGSTGKLDTSVLGTDNIQGIDTNGNGVDIVNKFIAEKTHEKIINPIKQLNGMTLALVNCIYFNKGFNFNSKNITWSDGKVYAGFSGEVACGWVKEPNKDIDVLKLDYKKDSNTEDYSLYIICDSVSSKEEKVTEYIKGLTDEEFKSLLDFSNGTVTGYDSIEFKLPDFEMEITTSAVNYLKNLGFKEAFNSGADSFKKLGDVYVRDIIHAAWIKTTKDGTEAAATTAVLFFRNAVILNTKHIKADSDFTFVIKNNSNDAILFIGRVADNSALTGVE